MTIREDSDALRSVHNDFTAGSKINWDEPIECVKTVELCGDEILSCRYLTELNTVSLNSRIVAVSLDGHERIINVTDDGRRVEGYCTLQVRNIKQEPREFTWYINVYDDMSVSGPYVGSHEATIEATKYGKTYHNYCIACKRIVVKEGEFDE